MTTHKATNTGLQSLIYTSFGPSLEMEDLVEIAKISAKNNARIGITGLLAFAPRQHKIIQLLEGNQDTLMKLMEKISKDSRHCQLQIIYNQPIAQRSFAEWSMGLKEVLEIPPRVTDQISFKDIESLTQTASSPKKPVSRSIKIFKAFLNEYS